MTPIRFRLFAIVATLAASSFLARADTFNFAVSGSAGGISGSGIFTASETGSGDFLIIGITGTGVTGLIAPGGFNGNDNLLFPSSQPVLDSQGFSFTAVDGPDQFDVNVFSDGTGYFAFFRDQDAFTDTLPISFELGPATSPIPEPPTLFLIGTGLLGAAGAVRKGSHIGLRNAIYQRLREVLGLPSSFPQKKSDIPRANL
ncbi:PEP-CTERM sorting domain-containing protein [Edaphobacter modestus]|uniref:Putative secreted protein with PEP-CTERM sorting signal n=1 Tax=Edaphobacter modestus TaxID=388466 RepID=A0A4Q7YPV4_9BACT|nr:PEP-CTERM sorting domain-containing protein [Edaphobacter modestus]RZU39727.1 putative secreted protein with PEP-CTERM sorting signal [Edaphobacter modestus]